MVKVYVTYKMNQLFDIEKIFKKQEDAEKFCSDRNTDMYAKSYGYMEYELE